MIGPNMLRLRLQGDFPSAHRKPAYRKPLGPQRILEARKGSLEAQDYSVEVEISWKSQRCKNLTDNATNSQKVI